MQDAEEDEAVRRGEPGDGRNGEGGHGNNRQALPEAVPTDFFAVGQEQADANEKEEGRSDATRIDLPPAEGCQTGIGVPEEFEIPGEMVARHGKQGDAAENVEADDAPWLILNGYSRRMDAHGLAI